MDGVRLMGFVQRSPVLAEGSSLPTMLAIHEECGEMWACRRAELGKDREIFPITVGSFNCGEVQEVKSSLVEGQAKTTGQVEAGAAVVMES
ncbi:hypothetical protein TURU_029721 [Turdus rufiventris]|nr:hypothetical protein TURU_029721 [Turdus rufiventris]